MQRAPFPPNRKHPEAAAPKPNAVPPPPIHWNRHPNAPTGVLQQRSAPLAAAGKHAPPPAIPLRGTVAPPPVHWARSAAPAIQQKTSAAGAPECTIVQAKSVAPPPVHWPRPAPAVQAKPKAAHPAAATVIQRQVSKYRSGKNKGRWYTDLDESQTFDTKEQAEEYLHALQDEAAERKKIEKEAKRRIIIAERKKKLIENFSDYTALATTNVRLFKKDERKRVDTTLTNLTADNAKKFMENQIALRRADEFSAKVMEIGGRYFVLDRGRDIGIKPGLLRPDLDKKDGYLPLSRIGMAKPYSDLSSALDKMVDERAEELDLTKKQIRQRMGKDLDRLTRNSAPQGTIAYSDEEMDDMTELSAIMRLDKGRVPKATSYIRETFTSGTHSFRQLLVDKKYIGAKTGGVEALRGIAVDGGEQSEGSDIEEPQNLKKRKRRVVRRASDSQEPKHQKRTPGDP